MDRRREPTHSNSWWSPARGQAAAARLHAADDGNEKLVKLAQKEVQEGKVERVPIADCRLTDD